jgi:hypothetical protein
MSEFARVRVTWASQKKATRTRFARNHFNFISIILEIAFPVVRAIKLFSLGLFCIISKARGHLHLIM